MTGWIQTYSGRRFFPLAPDPADVVVEDVAHALSLVCRFQGHCTRFYSVAEHSVHVARVMWQRAAGWPVEGRRLFSLFGLLHDSGEAYLADVSRPVKRFLRVENFSFSVVEERVVSAVWEALCPSVQRDPQWWGECHSADDALLQRERLVLFRDPPEFPGLDCAPAAVELECLGPEQAERLFLASFRTLSGGSEDVGS